jgi:hypothetical protein
MSDAVWLASSATGSEGTPQSNRTQGFKCPSDAQASKRPLLERRVRP